MARPVDRDLLGLYLLGELGDRASEEVEHLVAEDAAWAAALQEEAQLEMQLFEVAEAAGQREEAVEPVPSQPQVPGWMMTARRWWFGLGGALAATLALLLIIPDIPPPEPLPGYSLELRSTGEATLRGGDEPDAVPAELPRFVEGSVLEFAFVPDVAVEGDLEVQLFLDGQLTSVAPELTPKGVVRFSGVFGEDLPILSDGKHTLRVLVMREGATSGQTGVQTLVFGDAGR